MIMRLLEVRPPLTLMYHTVLIKLETRNIEADVNLPPHIDDVLRQPAFLDGLTPLHKILNPITHSLGLLEADTITTADVYA